ncbi:MAG: hypothetical protein ACYC7E_10735, partial [Armatimonadota bacterium]
MSTENQITANRQNAHHSTGPRTPAGKARSSMNALKHGFFAKETLLPQEDAAEFTTFADALRDDLQPSGALEAILADQLIASAWRMKRYARIETGVFADLLSEAQREYACLQEEEAALDGAPLPAIPPEAVWGHAFTQSVANGAPLDKLTRCQNTVTRDFYRALRELQRLQSTRPAVNWEHQTDEIMPVVQNEPN